MLKKSPVIRSILNSNCHVLFLLIVNFSCRNDNQIAPTVTGIRDPVIELSMTIRSSGMIPEYWIKQNEDGTFTMIKKSDDGLL